ncbi:MAG: insecticidal toxin complex protein, partial [Bacteroidetes bacterium]|nr:insecticidal toxin complex protein [Bacteroidota bacterium]
SKGYIKLTASTYSSKSMPAVEFTYQAHQWNSEVKEISRENLLHAPTGLSKPYQFNDLYNEGLPGILTESAAGWYYKRNLGEGNFAAARLVSPKPSFSGLGAGMQLVDLEADGVKQIVNFNNNPQGFFEIDDDEAFQRFKAFRNLPNVNFNDPQTRLIDLNGDGKTDLLITEDTVFTWYESDGREGFSDYHRTPKTTDEEKSPHVIFADQEQSIFLADMGGDGLVDIVRIRNGEICYWPNLGYGNFGAKVGMDNAPVFDTDYDFNPSYIKIADIDGSGTPDIIYLGKNKFTCWLNLSGNKFSTTPYEITAFPAVHNDAEIDITDLLGNGLSCIVWSSPLQKDSEAPLRYIDLMNSTKPHIMMAYKNNMGKEVELQYTPSTKYYVSDKQADMPWATKLHFPIHCLSRVITRDKVTGHVFSSNYTYHHGYYDHAEREFRGFGRVDQTDTESFENWTSPNASNLVDITVNQAPVLTRSWFHTGAWMRDKKILDQFATEYWYAQYNKNFTPITPVETALPGARIVPDKLNPNNQDLVDDLNPVEQRQAYRSCKSLPLRVEIFALEGTAQQQAKPISVSTHNCMIELLQPQGKNKYAIFCVKESEAITYHYERDIADPRIAHTMNLDIDIYGNVLEAVSIVYPRLIPDNTLPSFTQGEQNKTNIIFTVNDFTNEVQSSTAYRLPLPAETRSYEVTALPKAGSIYVVSEFDDLYINGVEIPYEASPSISPSTHELRLLEHIQTLYYANNLTGSLALGILESRALVYENYQLAYTNNNFSNLVTNIFGTKVNATLLTLGQFTQINNDWWIRSGTVQFISGVETVTAAIARFFTPVSFTDPYGSVTKITYDSNFFLFIKETEDALVNKNKVETFDYRTLSPVKMKDLNDNLSEVLLDELMMPKAMALYGKGTQADELTGLTAQTSGAEQTNIDNYFNEADADVTNSVALHSAANTLLQRATMRFVYDLHRYVNSNGADPTVVSSIVREEHYAINNNSPIQTSFEYSGGFGKVVMKKMQAEPGLAKKVTDNNNGTVTVTTIDTSVVNPGNTPPLPVLRWIGNGRTVVNNKGNVVKQYEPYFSVTAKYESHKELVDNGVTPIMYYDAMGRLVRADMPDKSFSKVSFNSWKQSMYDQNDTADTFTPWYQNLISFGPNSPEGDAAIKANTHVNTPKIMHFDSLGRPVTEQETDGTNTLYTHLTIDIEGNLRKVKDARNNFVMQYKYDLLGHMVYQTGMDSGQRWLFNNCMGAPLRTWDERNFEVRFSYDVLHRPLTTTVLNGDGPSALNNITDKFIYGEGQPNDKQLNLRGNLFQHYDTGGLEKMAQYDFKYNALSTERWLASNYKIVVDWNVLTGKLEATSFVIATSFDALGRIKLQTAPDNSVITPTYSQRGVLVSEIVNQGAGNVTHLNNIKYDAKGQRMKVVYGNGTFTDYTYDTNTFRLIRLLTKNSANVILQDLKFYYDAVGNITWKKDDAVPATFFANNMITTDNKYTYDALYRLKQANGREKIAGGIFGSSDNWNDAPFLSNLAVNSNLPQRTYTENYQYDNVGNITQLQHLATGGNYMRNYAYASTNNRLLSTTVGAITYNYIHHAQHG